MKATCRGLNDFGKVRKTNEDFLLIDDKLGLYIVCDGVSGHAAGDVASALCANSIRDVIAKNTRILDEYKRTPTPALRGQVSNLVQKAIEYANGEIFKAAEADPKKNGMSTTVVACLMAGDHLVIGHVGDSRVYLLRGGKAHKLTDDHKVSVELKKQGWTDEEVARSPYANVLTRAVGIQEYTPSDVLQIELSAGDRFLLCSDGCYEYFDADRIAAVLGEGSATSEGLDQLAKKFVEEAKAKGGRDNITVALIGIDSVVDQSQTLTALKKSDALGKVPLFRFFDYAELLKVLNIFRTQDYSGGDELFKEGSVSTELFVIVSGQVEVKKGTQLIAKLGKGEVFGEMGIFDNAPRSASVSAVEKTTALICTRRDLLALLRREGQLTVKLLWALNQEMNRRLRDTTQELAKLRATISEDEDTLTDLPFPSPEG